MHPRLSASKRTWPSIGCTYTATEAEPQATGSNARRDPTPERTHGRDLMETGFNGLLEALTITKEISAVFPPLQAAVGGLLAALEKYKASIVG